MIYCNFSVTLVHFILIFFKTFKKENVSLTRKLISLEDVMHELFLVASGVDLQIFILILVSKESER